MDYLTNDYYSNYCNNTGGDPGGGGKSVIFPTTTVVYYIIFFPVLKKIVFVCNNPVYVHFQFFINQLILIISMRLCRS